MRSPYFMQEQIINISKSKESLLRNSIRLLATKHWDNISIEDIEKVIKKTRGSIFHHYESKDNLFRAAYSYFISLGINKYKDEKISTLYIVLLELLKSEFRIDNPEFGLLNLIIQGVSKNIQDLKLLFQLIEEEKIVDEELYMGQAIISIINNTSCCNQEV